MRVHSDIYSKQSKSDGELLPWLDLAREDASAAAEQKREVAKITKAQSNCDLLHIPLDYGTKAIYNKPYFQNSGLIRSPLS